MTGKFTRQVHQHGSVTLLNLAGPTRRPDYYFDADDRDPPNVARLSFDGMDSGRTAEEDEKLARYLMKNGHTSPFEMVQVWLDVKVPIFVARQWQRHRTMSLNEISGRYKQLPAEWYIPDIKDVVLQSKDKKQGGRLVDVHCKSEYDIAAEYTIALDGHCEAGYVAYEFAIARGIAMEQARLFLHLNHYTHWVQSSNLHNMMHFLALRDHSHAQREVQAYAKAITEVLEIALPKSIAIYREFRRRE